MKLNNVVVKNYRLLKDISLNINCDDVTSIVGKNNSGKTSFSCIFRDFILSRSFEFDDFSLECRDIFYKLFVVFLDIDPSEPEKIQKVISEFPRIELRLDFTYSSEDNFNSIKPFLTSLSDDNSIGIHFEYGPKSVESLFKKIKSNLDDVQDKKQFLELIRSEARSFLIRLIPISDEFTPMEVTHSDVEKLFHIHFIDAQRRVDDSNIKNASKLSTVFQTHYRHVEKEDDESPKELKAVVKDSNESINEKLKTFFQPFIESFKIFGFPGMEDQDISLISELHVERLLEGNVRLFYGKDEELLSEKYNGLGYSNLIFIISEILGYHYLNEANKKDLTVIFIEEPEAHMHPQMQDVFIRNIKNFLVEKGFNVQLIISTHSSHIIANSNLKSIRYFDRIHNDTEVKDLQVLNDKLGDESEVIKFLTKYLTLGKCDLFFADKAVLFEGVVERILLPEFIKKMPEKSLLSSQYIAKIEVGGAYMHKFKEIIEFISLKTLVFTDLDSVDGEKKEKVEVNMEAITSNECLKSWVPKKESVKDLVTCKNSEKEDGYVRVEYQREENKKIGRSFEEAFVIKNYEYIFDNKDKLNSIKYILRNVKSKEDVLSKSYEIQNFIDRNKKKTDFAFELLTINSNDWDLPSYIDEGLKWLAQ